MVEQRKKESQLLNIRAPGTVRTNLVKLLQHMHPPETSLQASKSSPRHLSPLSQKDSWKALKDKREYDKKEKKEKKAKEKEKVLKRSDIITDEEKHEDENSEEKGLYKSDKKLRNKKRQEP